MTNESKQSKFVSGRKGRAKSVCYRQKVKYQKNILSIIEKQKNYRF